MFFMERKAEEQLVSFIILARYAAKEGYPRDSEQLKQFRFAAMGADDEIRRLGLNPDAIIDAVYLICG
jgi:hypothetical protein